MLSFWVYPFEHNVKIDQEMGTHSVYWDKHLKVLCVSTLSKYVRALTLA